MLPKINDSSEKLTSDSTSKKTIQSPLRKDESVIEHLDNLNNLTEATFELNNTSMNKVFKENIVADTIQKLTPPAAN